jgi:uncharacterized membrane protein HdeD (DUF308 family)
MTLPQTDDELLDDDVDLTRGWWIFLVTGIVWLLFGFLVLTWEAASVWTVAILASIAFVVGGLMELATAAMVSSWRWLHVVFGVVSVAAGIMALAWPEQTFVVLASILAWYLLITGVFEIVAAFLSRDLDDMWWLRLVIGLAQVLIGFWAVGYAGRAVALLVVWVAAAAIARGLSSLFVAFGLHKVGKQLQRRVH